MATETLMAISNIGILKWWVGTLLDRPEAIPLPPSPPVGSETADMDNSQSGRGSTRSGPIYSLRSDNTSRHGSSDSLDSLYGEVFRPFLNHECSVLMAPLGPLADSRESFISTIDIASLRGDDIVDTIAGKLLTYAIENESIMFNFHSPQWPWARPKKGGNKLSSPCRRAYSPQAWSQEPFRNRSIPLVAFEDYAVRFARHCPDRNEVFIAVYIYLNRLSELGLLAANRIFVFNKHNVHRSFMAALAIANKMFGERGYSNYHIADVGGITVRDLNNMERQMLALLDYRVAISAREFDDFADDLTTISRKEVELERQGQRTYLRVPGWRIKDLREGARDFASNMGFADYASLNELQIHYA